MKLDSKGGVSIATIMIVGTIIAAGAGGTYIAKEEGLMPWTETPRAPSNLDVVKVNTDEFLTGGDSQTQKLYVEPELYRMKFEDILKDINLDDFKYQVYKTSESPAVIIDTYKTDLLDDGFEVIVHEDETLYGSFIYEDVEIYYGAFIEGLTATFVASVNEIDSTYVLYITGNVLDFQELVDDLDIDL